MWGGEGSEMRRREVKWEEGGAVKEGCEEEV